MVSTRFVNDVVVVGSQSESPALNLGRGENRGGFVFTNDVLLWLVVREDGELSAIEILVELLDTKNDG